MPINLLQMTPAEERELLELAAKACDIPYGRDRFICGVNVGGISYPRWNPLHNSGDCFDAAAKCRAEISHLDKAVHVTIKFPLKAMESFESFDNESERPAATRLAVTRAVAEIGRAMGVG